jgi:hypothetical protein
MRRLGSLALVLTVTAAPAAAEPAPGDPATRAVMHGIFDAISKVLPLSFDDAAFRDEKHREEIATQLAVLRDRAGALEEHARGKDRAFEYVAKSLSADAGRLAKWYARGSYGEAQFTVQNMTENCIACHSSLRETHQYPAAKSFFAAVRLETLTPLERARYYVMSRQFDDALATYEAYFTRGSVPPSSLAGMASVVDYLKVCLNVKHDVARPRRLLAAVAAGIADDPTTKGQLTRWIAQLDKLAESRALDANGIAAARLLLERGRSEMEFFRDRDGVVYYVAANAILNAFIHGRPDRGRDVAEAYYLLGITESLLSHSFWVSRTEFDLESAIRLAPAAPFAPKAYALLEESYVVGYSGSSGTHLPEEVRDLLAELRTIIRQAQGGKS